MIPITEKGFITPLKDLDYSVLYILANEKDFRSLVHVAASSQSLYKMADKICTAHFIPLKNIFDFEILWETVMIHDFYNHLPHNSNPSNLDIQLRSEYLQNAFSKPITTIEELLLFVKNQPDGEDIQQMVLDTLKLLIILKRKTNFEKITHHNIFSLDGIVHLPFNSLVMNGLKGLLEFHEKDPALFNKIKNILNHWHLSYVLKEFGRLKLENEANLDDEAIKKLAFEMTNKIFGGYQGFQDHFNTPKSKSCIIL